MDKQIIVPAGKFKQTCLALLDEVAEKHHEIIISKRGKPIARLVAMDSDKDIEKNLLAHLRQGAEIRGSEEELLQPSSRFAKWKVMP